MDSCSQRAALSPPPEPTEGPRRRRVGVGTAAVTVAALALAGLAVAAPAQAATGFDLVATPSVGKDAYQLAVDPLTHTVYAANSGSDTVSVIDGASRTVTGAIRLPAGAAPIGIGVDPDTHTLYTANYFNNTVSAIDTVSRTVKATLRVSARPIAVAVDRTTHTVYVATNVGNNVAVIDGTTNTVTATVPVSSDAFAIAVDPGTRTVWVAGRGSSTLSVIDQTTNTVVATQGYGGQLLAIAIDSSAHTAYLTSSLNTVTAIDTVSRAVTRTAATGNRPGGVAVDPGTHTVVITNSDDGAIAAHPDTLDAAPITTSVGGAPYGIGLDVVDHTVYALDPGAASRLLVLTPAAPTQAAQTVTFTSSPPSPARVGGSYPVTATGGGSGNPVTFTLDATSAGCTLTDGGDSTARVTFTATGTCVIDADQAGGPGYAAATQAQQSVSVLTAVPTAVVATPVCTYLACTFDGSGSSDPDGTIAAYAWDFGDGSTGTGATTSHTYAGAGTYTVGLVVTDDAGQDSPAATTSVTVAANQAPTAVIGTPSCTFLGCAFSGASSSDPDGSVAAYAWTFGDGTTGSGVAPTHVYSRAGTYPVGLVVTDDQGATSAAAQTSVTVKANKAPTAVITTATCTYLQCAFDGSTSSDSDGTVASYAWNFGDGTTSTDAKPTHLYAKNGTYKVTLAVTDDQGARSRVASQSVTVKANVRPTAAFTTSCTQLVCGFDASTSTDPDGTIVEYAWSFGDGGTALGVAPSHTYAKRGSFTVTLTVRDNAGATTVKRSTLVVTGPNQTPTANFAGNGADLLANFDGRPSADPDGTIAAYAWNFGDGTTGTGGTASHTYASSGIYAVTLTVTDNDGATASKSHTLTVVAARSRLLVADNFARTASNSWGVPTVGQGWSMNTATSNYSVDGSAGLLSIPRNNTVAIFPTASVLNSTQTIDVGVSGALPSGGVYATLAARRTVGGAYLARVFVSGSGAVELALVKRSPTAGDTVLTSTPVSGVTVTPGSTIRVRLAVNGDGTTTTIVGKAWDSAKPEPTAPTATVTDATRGDLQKANGVGVGGTTFGTNPTGTVVLRFQNYTLITP